MQNQTHADKINAFIEICHRNHLKMTPQRSAIFQALIDSDTHPTADTIFQSVKKDYPHMSFDTVHRTLLTFAEIGIIDAVEIFSGAKRFDPNVKNHHNLHCTQCGKILDFYSSAYDNLEVPADVPAQFKVTSKRVVLKGVCGTCRK